MNISKPFWKENSEWKIQKLPLHLRPLLWSFFPRNIWVWFIRRSRCEAVARSFPFSWLKWRFFETLGLPKGPWGVYNSSNSFMRSRNRFSLSARSLHCWALFINRKLIASALISQKIFRNFSRKWRMELNSKQRRGLRCRRRQKILGARSWHICIYENEKK